VTSYEAAPLARRAAAVGLDYLIVAAYVAVVVLAGVALLALAPQFSEELFGQPLSAEGTGFLALTLPVMLYFAFTEASVTGATWGKRRMRMRVLGPGDQRLSRARSLVRSSWKFAPWELAHAGIWQIRFAEASAGALAIGLLGASWILVMADVACAVVRRDHRALHDLVSGGRVVMF
jgi:uncharacterized RDD family membrane protein YckC